MRSMQSLFKSVNYLQLIVQHQKCPEFLSSTVLHVIGHPPANIQCHVHTSVPYNHFHSSVVRIR